MNEARFIDAVLDPARPLPEGLVTPDGRPARRRFAVYRNNVAVGLTAALGAAFPALRAVLGRAAFDRMAAGFLRRHPPVSPVLAAFGAALPRFLAGYAPLARLGYLPDLARLERALTESYHAADAPALAPGALAGLAPEDLARHRIAFAPAVRLLQSRWPILSIHARALDPAAPAPAPGGQAVVVLRPGYDPQPERLPPGGATLMIACREGRPLAEAAAAARAAAAGAPVADILSLLARGGAICRLLPPEVRT